ncbi:MAG TPA: hypothetical protein VLM16_00770, partial [Ginsengibacter sp.]|nr:hypothetical protein [Ginsengibacter sp.]
KNCLHIDKDENIKIIMLKWLKNYRLANRNLEGLDFSIVIFLKLAALNADLVLIRAMETE